VFEYDPSVNIQHHPTPGLSRFGVNQFSEPLFRIVWSESVRHLVGGMWPDGDVGYHWVKTYKFQPGCWVLEQWMMPSESPKQWNARIEPLSGFPLLGPYPARGHYQLVFIFDHGVDNDSLDKVIATARHKQTRSFQDDKDLLKGLYDYEEKETKTNVFEEFRDAVQFRPTAALSYGRFGRGTKTEPNLKTAEELGLRVPQAHKRNPKDLRGIDLTSTLGSSVRA
jgi:hypothetical protein